MSELLEVGNLAHTHRRVKAPVILKHRVARIMSETRIITPFRETRVRPIELAPT